MDLFVLVFMCLFACLFNFSFFFSSSKSTAVHFFFAMFFGVFFHDRKLRKTFGQNKQYTTVNNKYIEWGLHQSKLGVSWNTTSPPPRQNFGHYSLSICPILLWLPSWQTVFCRYFRLHITRNSNIHTLGTKKRINSMHFLWSGDKHVLWFS